MDEINTEVEQLYADVKGIIWNYCSYFPFKDDVELKTLYKWDYANDNTHILATCHSIAVHDEMVYICYDDINSWCIYNITTKQNHAIKIEPLPIEYEECYMIVRNIGDIMYVVNTSMSDTCQNIVYWYNFIQDSNINQINFYM